MWAWKRTAIWMVLYGCVLARFCRKLLLFGAAHDTRLAVIAIADCVLSFGVSNATSSAAASRTV